METENTAAYFDASDSIPRRLALPPKRAFGLLVLVLLPLLAVSGLTSLRGEATTAEGSLQLVADYPRVLRYLKPTIMRLGVTNHGIATLADVRVYLDADYLDAFTSLALTPTGELIDDSGMLVQLGELAPGETRYLRIEMRASHYWLQQGSAMATAGDTRADLDLRTLVLP